jgi:hypothetical protein
MFIEQGGKFDNMPAVASTER